MPDRVEGARLEGRGQLLGLALLLRTSCPCRPGAAALAGLPAPRRARPVPVGPSSALCPGTARRSMPISRTSIGRTPAVWAASSRKSAPCSCASAGGLARRQDRPDDVAGVAHRHEPDRAGAEARSRSSRSSVPSGAQATRVTVDAALGQGVERPDDGVVLDARGDDAVTRPEQAPERHVQRVGRVEREHDARGVRGAEQRGELRRGSRRRPRRPPPRGRARTGRGCPRGARGSRRCSPRRPAASATTWRRCRGRSRRPRRGDGIRCRRTARRATGRRRGRSSP